MRPTIKRNNGIWICKSHSSVGYGDSPYEAWQKFIRHSVGY